ncbi:MAG: isochorismatase [Chloroflexi bacterium HGW-Chloroflexi-4]|jgi:nicotinamidase-related amidase|nr:MAG: isochorismatase [Chloroflexi bacterium HGW-Chloroflexi-4]
MKPALLVIDIQNQFFKEDPDTAKSLESAVNYFILPTITLFHEKKLPVVFVQHMEKDEGIVPGVEGFEMPDSFDVQPDDLRITKTYNNAFIKTDLHAQLQALGVDTLIVTGYCAEWCILSTLRGAWDLDYKAIVLLGAIASGSKEGISFVENYHASISLGALQTFIKALP